MGLDMNLYRIRNSADFAGFDPHLLYGIKSFLTGDRRIPKNGKWFSDGKQNPDMIELGTGIRDFLRYHKSTMGFINGRKNQIKLSASDYDKYSKLVMQSQPEEIGYWRNAAGLHRYLVANAQDGIDDCNYHEVGADVLAKLLSIFYKAAPFHGQKLINALDKTFDDSSNLLDDENYEIRDSKAMKIKNPDSKIKSIIDILEDAVNNTDFRKDKIYYLASW
jgi:hypothetical protein